MKNIAALFLILFITAFYSSAFAQSKEGLSVEESKEDVKYLPPDVNELASERTFKVPIPANPVEPVSPETLSKFLPEAKPGWEATLPVASKVEVGDDTYSFANREYTIDGYKTAEAQVTDYAYIGALYKGFEELYNSTFTEGTEYRKTIVIKDSPAVESFDSEAKYGEIAVLVKDRFMVQISCYNIKDTQILFDMLNSINLDELSQLK